MRYAMVLAAALAFSGCITIDARSGPGPPKPRPTVEELMEMQYPTKVPIVDGRPLHPVTGKPFNCELMAPFEERLEYRKKNPFKGWFRYGMWWDHTFFEIRGWQGYAFGAHGGHMRQGIAMSRACRALGEPSKEE